MRYAAAAWILAASALAAQTVEGLVVDAATGAGAFLMFSVRWVNKVAPTLSVATAISV